MLAEVMGNDLKSHVGHSVGPRKPGRKDINLLENRWLREQPGIPLRQDRAADGKKGLPVLFVGERAERRGPRRNPNQKVEAFCRWTIDSPSRKKRSTSASFPGLASK